MALTQVNSDGIATGAVTATQIATGAVTANDLEDSGVTAGTYGSSSAIPAITVDAKGRITAASTNAIDSDRIFEGNTSAEVVDTGSDGHFKVITDGTERLRVDNSGRLLAGSNTARTDFFNFASSYGSRFLSELSGDSDGLRISYAAVRNSNNVDSGFLAFGKSRGTSNGSATIVQNGDALGEITFQGADGSELVPGASIKVEVDGTPGANDMPSRMLFKTTADGASSPTERLRIANTGALGLSGANYGTSGQVLTSQGSGSAPQWATVSTPSVAFESFAVIADQKASGSDGGTFSNGDWRTRDLNTELFDPDGIVSISSNQFTLGAGTYYMVAHAPAHRVDKHVARIRNMTDATVIAYGTTEVANNGTYNSSTSKVFARVTITSSKAFEVQHRCQTTFTGNGFGWSTDYSVEKYTVVEIFKEA